MRIAIVGLVLLCGVPASMAEGQQISEPMAVANFAWRQIPPTTSRCVSAQLAQKGFSIRYLVEQGILPSDPRIEPLVTECSAASANNDPRSGARRRSAIVNSFPDNPTQSPADVSRNYAPEQSPSVAESGRAQRDVEAQRQARMAEQARREEETRKTNSEGLKNPTLTPSSAGAAMPSIDVWFIGEILLAALVFVGAVAFRRKQLTLEGAAPSIVDSIKRMTLADWSAPIMMFVFVISLPLATMISSTSVALLRAVGLLLVPAAFLLWIGATIKSLHAVDQRFWTMRTTWVLLAFGLAAVILLWMGVSVQNMQAENGVAHVDYSTTLAGIIVLVGASLWALRSNWLATKNPSLALSLVGLQLLSGAFILGAVWLLLFGRGEGGKHREGQLS